MNESQYKEAVVILKKYYKAIETIDEDVFSKMKQADIAVVQVARALSVIGLQLWEAIDLLKTSSYYAESSKNVQDLTQSFFDALVELSKTKDRISLTENGVSIDLTKLKDEKDQ